MGAEAYTLGNDSELLKSIKACIITEVHLTFNILIWFEVFGKVVQPKTTVFFFHVLSGVQKAVSIFKMSCHERAVFISFP